MSATGRPQHLVLLCGGQGTRLRRGGAAAKCLTEVGGTTLLARLCATFGRQHEVSAPPVVVVAEGDALTPAYARRFLPGARVLVQARPDGVVSALLLAEQALAGDPWVVLGDLAMGGVLGDRSEGRDGDLIVWAQAPPAATVANFGVGLDGARVTSVIEKPPDPTGLACGLGVYRFDRDLLALLGEAPVGPRGEREITEALAFALAHGAHLGARAWHGWYVNVNTDADRADAESAATHEAAVAPATARGEDHPPACDATASRRVRS